jgi:hypothetical protein
MLNTSEPDGLPRFHIANIVIQFIKTRPKSPMSLIVLLPRGTVVRIRENPPHHSQNPSSRVQPSYGGQRFCAHEQAERLSNELARSFAQSSQRSG